VQIAGHEGDGKSVIASVPLTITTALSTIVSPPSPAGNAPTPSTIAASPSPATSAPDHRQVSAPPVNSPRPAPRNAATTGANSPQTTPLDTAPLNAATTAVTASTTAATTDLAQEPVPAAKKSQKTARSANERNRGGHDAAGWGRYAHERPTSSW
jgi:hypothetical protein